MRSSWLVLHRTDSGPDVRLHLNNIVATTANGLEQSGRGGVDGCARVVIGHDAYSSQG